MNITTTRAPVLTYKTASFNVDVIVGIPETHIRLKMDKPYTKTGCFSETLSILSADLPGVLETKCFNTDQLPFSEEVKDTEIGHLFEHILIQYLFEEEEVKFKGVTKWNWDIEERGFFRITVSSDFDYCGLLEEALEKTVALTEKIILSCE